MLVPALNPNAIPMRWYLHEMVSWINVQILCCYVQKIEARHLRALVTLARYLHCCWLISVGITAKGTAQLSFILSCHDDFCTVDHRQTPNALLLGNVYTGIIFSFTLEIPSDSYTTHSQNLTGCSTVSQGCCKLIG